MRLLLLLMGSLSSCLAACAQSDTGVGGVAGYGAVAGSDSGKPDSQAGGAGGFGGSFGGVGGGAGGSVSGGGMGGVPAGGGGTSAGGVSGGGGTGATGGSGGTSGCTPPVSGGLCDTFPQCGCSANQACNVTSVAGTTQCTPVGSVPPYNKCTALNDCTKGYVCVGDTCKPYCEQNTDCTGGICAQVTDGGATPTPIPGMKVCTKICKLENPSADCGAGLSCYPDTSQTPASTDCAGAGTATTPGACLSDTTACAPGYACLDNGDCRKWCRVGMTTDCGGGQCLSFTTKLIIASQEYGVCQ